MLYFCFVHDKSFLNFRLNVLLYVYFMLLCAFFGRGSVVWHEYSWMNVRRVTLATIHVIHGSRSVSSVISCWHALVNYVIMSVPAWPQLLATVCLFTLTLNNFVILYKYIYI